MRPMIGMGISNRRARKYWKDSQKQREGTLLGGIKAYANMSKREERNAKPKFQGQENRRTDGFRMQAGPVRPCVPVSAKGSWTPVFYWSPLPARLPRGPIAGDSALAGSGLLTKRSVEPFLNLLNLDTCCLFW